MMPQTYQQLHQSQKNQVALMNLQNKFKVEMLYQRVKSQLLKEIKFQKMNKYKVQLILNQSQVLKVMINE